MDDTGLPASVPELDITEGVLMGQRDILVQLGCESAQGYFFGRAVPAEEFEALLPALQGA